MKAILAVAIVVAVVIALLFALNIQSNVFNFLFGQTWSKMFWTNFIFIAVVAGAIALAITGK